MIRKFFALFAALTTTVVVAQTDIDAIRYSQTQSYGNARFMSMGGAFGSLGANVSCMNFNPAGIAMYRKGEFVFTPGVQFQSADATHYGTNTTDFSSKLNISNIGFVAAWDQQQEVTSATTNPIIMAVVDMARVMAAEDKGNNNLNHKIIHPVRIAGQLV